MVSAEPRSGTNDLEWQSELEHRVGAVYLPSSSVRSNVALHR